MSYTFNRDANNRIIEKLLSFSETPGIVNNAASLGSTGNTDSATINTLTLAGTTITASGADINKLSGITAGTAAASKVLVLDSAKDISGINSLSCASLTVNGTAITSGGGGAELPAYIETITAGTAAASKALVLDADSSISGINSFSCTTLLVNGSSVGTPDIITSITNGTATASKALVLDASKNISEINTLTTKNLSLTGSAYTTNLLNNWVNQTTPNSYNFKSVCWSPILNMFAAVHNSAGVGTILTSTDGITWTSSSTPNTNTFNFVYYSMQEQRFYAIGGSGSGNRFMYSSNGTAWTASTTPQDNNWVCLVSENYDNGMGGYISIALANSGTTRMMHKISTSAWTASSSFSLNDSTWTSICHSPYLNTFCGVASSGPFLAFTGTYNTSVARSVPAQEWRSVCWSPALKLFCAVASSGTGNRVITSPTGVTWTSRTSAADLYWISVIWVDQLGAFVATANNNGIMNSVDGINWLLVTPGITETITSVCWSPKLSMLAATTSSGTNRIFTSVDATPNTNLILSTNSAFNSSSTINATSSINYTSMGNSGYIWKNNSSILMSLSSTGLTIGDSSYSNRKLEIIDENGYLLRLIRKNAASYATADLTIDSNSVFQIDSKAITLSTLNYAGNITLNGKIVGGDSTASTSETIGGLKLTGGLAISNTTEASNNSNGGSITTAGGVGIAKKLYVGGGIITNGLNTTGVVTLGGTITASGNIAMNGVLSLAYPIATSTAGGQCYIYSLKCPYTSLLTESAHYNETMVTTVSANPSGNNGFIFSTSNRFTSIGSSYITPITTDTYTIYALSTKAYYKIFLNGKLFLSNLTNNGTAVKISNTLAVIANQSITCTIYMQSADSTTPNNATLQLNWSYTSQAEVLIPAARCSPKFMEQYNSPVYSPNIFTIHNATSETARIESTVSSTGTVTNTAFGTDPKFNFTGGNIGLNVAAPGYLLELASDSAAKPSSSTWTISSDIRLKEDILDANLDLCYDNIKTLKLKYYKWRDTVYTVEQVKDRHKLGWIAQDVETVFPNAVDTIKANGLDDCKTLNTDQIIASLYGCVQKLIEKTEKLENENSELKNKITTIETFISTLEITE